MGDAEELVEIDVAMPVRLQAIAVRVMPQDVGHPAAEPFRVKFVRDHIPRDIPNG